MLGKNWSRFGRGALLCLAVLVRIAASPGGAVAAPAASGDNLNTALADMSTQATGQPLDRFESTVVGFENEDSKEMPAPGCTVFIGSSTFAHWHSLESVFKSYAAVNRGFGGSTIAEVNYYFQRLVAKYKPGKIVFYAGTNDIADGHSGEQVAADFKKFLALAHKQLPGVPLYFISMSMAPSRVRFASQYELGNKLIKGLCQGDKSLHYIDVTRVMLDSHGKLHTDYFGSDNLHMNQDGYDAWVPIILAALWADKH